MRVQLSISGLGQNVGNDIMLPRKFALIRQNLQKSKNTKGGPMRLRSRGSIYPSIFETVEDEILFHTLIHVAIAAHSTIRRYKFKLDQQQRISTNTRKTW